MKILDYDYKQPEKGDKGSTFFPALEYNINRLAVHSHDYSDSGILTTSSTVNSTQEILKGLWVAVSGHTGLFKQTITLLGGLEYPKLGIFFKEKITKDMLVLTVNWVSDTSYDVYINDNALDITAIYV